MRNDSPHASPIAAILLAAGTSSRMGAHKLLLPLGNRPLIVHTLDAVIASDLTPKLVVLGRDAERVRSALPRQGISVVINAEFASGMASSLRAGLAALPAAPIGALILLADQPLVTPELIGAILGEARAHPDAIVAATFAGQRGHPVYFPRQLFGQLSNIHGDEGGRSIVARHKDSLHLIDWPDLMAGLDVDTAEDYARLRMHWATRTDG